MFTFCSNRLVLITLMFITVLLSAGAPASAMSPMLSPFPTNEVATNNTPADSPSSTSPSTTIVNAAPAVLYESGTSATLFRWSSSGTSFARYSSHWSLPSGYTVSRDGNRLVSGDFNGDGTDDIATAHDHGTFFRFYVWLGGDTYQGSWYESGSYDLDRDQGRLVAGDWDGDGRDDLALGHDLGNNTARIYRFISTGSSFSHMAGDWVSSDGGYAFSRVGDRLVSGDFDSDGRDDIAAAYRNTDIFRFQVWLGGTSYRSNWYESTLDLDHVQGRLVAGDWDGDGRDDLALGYDYGDNTARIYRYRSTGTAFSHMAGDWVSSDGGYGWIRVGDRIAAGDVNGDGLDDIAAAYSYTDLFRFQVWLSGTTYRSNWYESSALQLDNVQGRFVLGRW